MKIEILVYSYLAVCLAMIGFNIVCIFLFSRNDRETEHSRLYYINLIKGQFGKEELDERHRLLMLKRLTKVRSLLSLNYLLYEIIVVDDGFSDETSAKMIEAFDMLSIRRPIQRKVECQPVEFVYEASTHKVPLTLIRKKNGGKADSLNMGINACKYPYFICIDADSVLQHEQRRHDKVSHSLPGRRLSP